jgi:DNA-binding transcriptional MocR family regulator
MEDALPPAVVGRLLRGEASFAVPAPALGTLEFRRQLSIKLAALEINASPSQIISTFGATHAVQLICRKMIQPGDSVLIEDPSYMVQQAQILDVGARILSVPRLQDGPDLDVLEELARKHRPRLFFTQSVLQNPTGSTTTPAISFRLLSLADKYNFFVVEDDVFGDVLGRPALRLASLDGLRRVFYVSSFTKVLSPALRVGYIVSPPERVDSLVERKILDVLSGSALQESLVTSVLKTGRYQAHLTGLLRRLHRVRARALSALTEMGIEFTTPSMDGLFLWGALPPHVAIDQLMSNASAQGILLTRGMMFSPTGGFTRHFRFNVAFCTDPKVLALLREACRKR